MTLRHACVYSDYFYARLLCVFKLLRDHIIFTYWCRFDKLAYTISSSFVKKYRIPIKALHNICLTTL